ncbi:GDSL esterase/lipase 1-like [Pyrus ussuriensis x Pyrus communis]|uniref:GDSL esterase/lipase 1-like n=1 Tax=Pyrus ussuriensis x Pyrus communis TaxID=2448454 RepID=A0A5N5GGC9_9ROSA|nr:GDSL esterase/lipase 1-like [Pyrus ussuriensis x Pyrus communis]
MANPILVPHQNLIYLLDITTQASHGDCGLPNKHTPAVPLFVFGDSIFDAGNNNFFSTVFQGNYWPYGEKGHPTGRISDGRIIPDFIAEYAKLPSIPPYLEPGNEEFKYGVNFASAGSGALIETRQGLGRDLHCQLSYFKNVGKSLRQKLGDEEAKSLPSRAVYVSNIGSNDYLFPFDTDSSMLRSCSREEFVGLVIGNITSVIKLESELKGFRYSLSDFHKFITRRIDHPSEYVMLRNMLCQNLKVKCKCLGNVTSISYNLSAGVT